MTPDEQYQQCESIDTVVGEPTLFERLFPRTKFNYSSTRQMRVIKGEVSELEKEVEVDDKPKALIEALDVMQATATFLYNTYTPDEIMSGLRAMYDKNNKRGYYDLGKHT